jgi:putative CocE/NonD family hydrolase
MDTSIISRGGSFLLVAVILISTACAPDSSGSPDLDGSLADDGIEFREAWIPMPDGVRLAADLWVPESTDAEATYPVLLEYLPYRKTESRSRNYSLYSYFLEHGYVVARVDIRGSGNSEGKLIEYEYTDQEQDDGEVVIDWLSKQSFSNGNVGMFGISWGGFNSIHMAMRNPPALKAIIAIDATDDIYEDDVHYMDGIAHIDAYEAGMDLSNTVPAAPDYIIDDAYFENRFDTKPWMLIYKSQQRDGPFWDRASLNTRYNSIEIPTFVIGGWYDGYRDAVARMLEHMDAPVKAMVGPWAHSFPHNAYPKPQMEWRHEAVRWFDYWLKGQDTGIMDEPSFAVYVRDWYPPTVPVEEVPGKWRFEEGFPLQRTEYRNMFPSADNSLSEGVRSTGIHSLEYDPTVGMEGGGNVMWWGDFTPDQQPMDDASLVYDSAPLDEEVEILGFPRAFLNASADAPLASWVVRLSDVAPDGSVTQVAGAGFNGAHRNSSQTPEALEPGREYPLEIELHFTSWVFQPGHRIRVAVTNSQWPMFWPTPYAMTTSLRLGGENATHLVLPVIPYEDRPVPEFLPPAELGPTLPGYGRLAAAEGEATTSGYAELGGLVYDEDTGKATLVAVNSGGTQYPWGQQRWSDKITHSTNRYDPADTSVRTEYSSTILVDGRELLFEAVLDFHSDLENFYYLFTRRLFENGELLREKSWDETIPRDFH